MRRGGAVGGRRRKACSARVGRSPAHRWVVQVPADAGVGVHVVAAGGLSAEFVVLFQLQELSWKSKHAENTRRAVCTARRSGLTNTNAGAAALCS